MARLNVNHCLPVIAPGEVSPMITGLDAPARCALKYGRKEPSTCFAGHDQVSARLMPAASMTHADEICGLPLAKVCIRLYRDWPACSSLKSHSAT